MPAGLLDAAREYGCDLKGCTVEIKATLVRGNDSHFAITKRPRGKILVYANKDAAQGA